MAPQCPGPHARWPTSSPELGCWLTSSPEHGRGEPTWLPSASASSTVAKAARAADHGGIAWSSAEELASAPRCLPSSSPSSHPPRPAPCRSHTDASTWPSLRHRRFASRRDRDAYLHHGSPPSQNGWLVWVSYWRVFWRCKTTVPTQNEFGSPLFVSFVEDSLRLFALSTDPIRDATTEYHFPVKNPAPAPSTRGWDHPG
jgi:hypothetical protein